MYYREWTKQPYTRSGLMLSQKGLKQILKSHNPGFASIYSFDEQDAQQIQEQGSSVGLNRFSVYADTLTLDLDTGDAGLKVTREFIKDCKLNAAIYESGKKGYHVVIDTEPMYSKDVPYSQKRFVENNGIPADFSRFRHDALLRLPGAIHEKTGKRKTLVETHVGSVLSIPTVIKPVTLPKYDVDAGDLKLFRHGIMRLGFIMDDEPPPGMRHQTIWQLSLSLREAGLSFDCVMELIRKVNDSWQQQKSDDELRRSVLQAFQKA